MKSLAIGPLAVTSLALASSVSTASAQIAVFDICPGVRDVSVLPDGGILYAAHFSASDPAESAVGTIEYQWGDVSHLGMAFTVAPHSAQRLANGNTLIADTGNHRVIEIDSSGQVIDLGNLTLVLSPTDARRLANGNTLIADTGNHRIIEVNAAGSIVWQYGMTGFAGSTSNRLRSPQKMERLANGNTLIADTGNNRVIEVNAARQVVWSRLAGLSAPHSAKRLANGNTLIADTGNNRVIEVKPNGQVVMMFATGCAVFDAEKMPSGNILCGDEMGIREFTPQGQVLNVALLGLLV